MYEAGEVNGSAVISCGETTEVLEAIEASLDAIALLVEFGVVRDRDFAISLGGDHGLGLHLGDVISQVIAVIGFIGENGVGVLALQERPGGSDVMGLSGGDVKPQRPAERVGEHVDLGGQSTSGTPQRLILGPPFPLAACWCARMIVLSSIRYLLSRSAVSASNTRSHTPAWHQRLKRRCTLFHLP